jgi:hypothetical protein
MPVYIKTHELTRNAGSILFDSTGFSSSTGDGTNPLQLRNIVAGGSTDYLALSHSTAPGCSTSTEAVGWIPVDVDDAVFLFVGWSATATSTSATLTVAAGDEERAYKRGQGAYTFNLYDTGGESGQSKTAVIGPFESARFAKKSTGLTSTQGSIAAGLSYIQVTLSTDGSNTTDQQNIAAVVAFKIPTVTYG